MLPSRLLLAALFLAIAPAMHAETQPAPIVFEVVSIKSSHAATASSGSRMDDGRFTATNILLKNLMSYTAFNIPEARIAGGPKWLNSQRFDMEAKLDAAALERWNHLDRHEHSLAGQALFQQLLADRFHLRYHWQTRILPIYALVVARRGAHLQPSTQEDADTDTNDGVILCKGVTLAGLARTLTQELSHELGRVVVDQTGLQGRYDLALKWTPNTGEGQHGGGEDAGLPPSDAPPSIFTAVEEQLGLKLVAGKGPVEVLVIDSLDLPSAN